MAKAKKWADDEMIVVLAFYFSYPRKSQVYNHPDCENFAAAIGRSRCAVDNQATHIHDDLNQKKPEQQCSKRLAELLDRYKDNLPLLFKEANEILERNKWDFPVF